MAATSGVRTCPSPTAWPFWNTSRPTDVATRPRQMPVGKSACGGCESPRTIATRTAFMSRMAAAGETRGRIPWQFAANESWVLGRRHGLPGVPRSNPVAAAPNPGSERSLTCRIRA
jgi:hypothetical protein